MFPLHRSQSVELTSDILERIESIDDLPPIYKRPPQQRVFVNTDLRMDKIHFVGFDMDYTLAEYISPAYEELSYDMSVEKLIEMGYPEEIKVLKYNPQFPIRGLFLDTSTGSLLKVDSYQYIVTAVHGHQVLSPHEVLRAYPSMQVQHNEIGKRYHLMNTLFNLVDACLYADLVDFLEKKSKIKAEECGLCEAPDLPEGGIYSETLDISFQNLFSDVRYAIDWIHNQGNLKRETQLNFPKYIHNKGHSVSLLLHRLKQAGKKTFLLTNSGYSYTDAVMKYQLQGAREDYPDWKDYFDYIIVGANKPKWFSEGSTLREVDLETGALKIGSIREFQKGHVYNGGSLNQFQNLTKAYGPRVLYVGDHIFSDIIVSKKVHLWRNLLIVPEITHQLERLRATKQIEKRIQTLVYLFGESFRGLNSESSQPPDLSILRSKIKEKLHSLNEAFNPYFGPLFKAGLKQSFFSMQIRRYADLYSSHVENLLNYPFFYYFIPISYGMPHEFQIIPQIAQSEDVLMDDSSASSSLLSASSSSSSSTSVGPSAISNPRLSFSSPSKNCSQ